MRMHVSSASRPKRITTTRSSTVKIAWSTAHPDRRCGSRYDIAAVGSTKNARRRTTYEYSSLESEVQHFRLQLDQTKKCHIFSSPTPPLRSLNTRPASSPTRPAVLCGTVTCTTNPLFRPTPRSSSTAPEDTPLPRTPTASPLRTPPEQRNLQPARGTRRSTPPPPPPLERARRTPRAPLPSRRARHHPDARRRHGRANRRHRRWGGRRALASPPWSVRPTGRRRRATRSRTDPVRARPRPSRDTPPSASRTRRVDDTRVVRDRVF